MKTLIVRSGNFVRFLITNHPEYRLSKLREQMPPGLQVDKMAVTDVKAKEIQLRFANCQVSNSQWYHLNDEFEQHIAGL